MSALAASPHLQQLLIDRASAWTGFRHDAILPQAMADLTTHRLRGCTEQQLEHAIEANDPVLVHDVCQAVSIGETYFFRNPDHFQLMAGELWPHFDGHRTIRAWSAGCATGEEAYSLAAMLLGRTRGKAPAIDVLGTDLVARNIETARLATYGRWSVRHPEPLAPIFESVTDDRITIAGPVRSLVTFREHNLLEPLPATFGKFQLIFCRNVLIYFDRAAIVQVTSHLRDALAPGGLLFFGSMDITESPVGLRRLGPAEHQIYEVHGAKLTVVPPVPARPKASHAPKPRAHSSIPRKPAAIPISTLPATASSKHVSPGSSPEPVAVHLKALSLIEAGDLDGADRLLRDLIHLAPTYLPALLERALLHLRIGERVSGHDLMRELLIRCRGRLPDEILAAPEPMTVAFVRASAQAFLQGVS